jgi:hypothetical protein
MTCKSASADMDDSDIPNDLPPYKDQNNRGQADDEHASPPIWGAARNTMADYF